jgi:DNA-binding transcriptional MerR regulator
VSRPPHPVAQLEKLYYRIGEVANIVGVEPHVLRYWETEFRSVRPQKSARGQRIYSRRDVETLLKVKELLYGHRFTIAGAKQRLRMGGVEELVGRAWSTDAARTGAPEAAPEPLVAAPSVNDGAAVAVGPESLPDPSLLNASLRDASLRDASLHEATHDPTATDGGSLTEDAFEHAPLAGRETAPSARASVWPARAMVESLQRVRGELEALRAEIERGLDALAAPSTE